jgi:4-amino-4-deoxy-L-arabinose transferase-like glycosyltransferase
MLLVLDSAPISAGVFLGLAILAKGLVPLVLFLPAVWYLWKRPFFVAWILGTAALVAAPWYILVTLRNGTPFLNEFFVKHHFSRFATAALQHQRPFWFYAPVLLAAIFPWTPLLPWLFRKSLYAGRPARFLLATLLFGVAFFSASRNKLPGYLLPLLPALAILLALALAEMRDARWALALTAISLGLIPAIAGVLPLALANGISHVHLQLNYWPPVATILLGLLVWSLEAHGRRDWALGFIASALTVLVAIVVWTTYPVLDHTVSARAYWRAHQSDPLLCSDNQNRAWRYGLDYYAGKPVPNCNFPP